MKKQPRFRTILISGATDGLGREFCKLYAANGYRLVMVGRDLGRLENLADDLRRKYGAITRLISQDLSADTAAANIRREIEGAGLQIDELLTRAGFRIYGPFSKKDLDNELERICAEYRGPGLPPLDPALPIRSTITMENNTASGRMI